MLHLHTSRCNQSPQSRFPLKVLSKRSQLSCSSEYSVEIPTATNFTTPDEILLQTSQILQNLIRDHITALKAFHQERPLDGILQRWRCLTTAFEGNKLLIPTCKRVLRSSLLDNLPLRVMGTARIRAALCRHSKVRSQGLQKWASCHLASPHNRTPLLAHRP